MTEDGYDTAGDTAEVDIVLSVRAGAGTAAGAGAGIRAGMGRAPVPAAGHRGDTGHAGAQRAGAAVCGIFRAGVRPSLAGGGPALLLCAGVPHRRSHCLAAERTGHHGGHGVLAGGDRRMYAALRTAAHGGAGGTQRRGADRGGPAAGQGAFGIAALRGGSAPAVPVGTAADTERMTIGEPSYDEKSSPLPAAGICAAGVFLCVSGAVFCGAV